MLLVVNGIPAGRSTDHVEKETDNNENKHYDVDENGVGHFPSSQRVVENERATVEVVDGVLVFPPVWEDPAANQLANLKQEDFTWFLHSVADSGRQFIYSVSDPEYLMGKKAIHCVHHIYVLVLKLYYSRQRYTRFPQV